MGCLAALIAIVAPRVFLVFVFVLTDWFGRAYETVIWPLLGFLLLPYTTIAYMAAMLNNDHRVDGLWLVLVIVAVLADLCSFGSSERHRRGRRR
jgi:hypothetical protein